MATRSETIRNDDGEATVTIVTPQLLTTVARGRATVPMVHTYFRFFHEFLDAATHKVDVFHDWYESTEVESEARATYLRWVHERQERHARVIRNVTALVGSPLIWVALQAGTITKSYAHALRAREPFEKALRYAAAFPSTDPIDK